ncbi:uncharacterized protein LOC107486901 [Arachis duranensis]|uniref:Uncharacterized protein LOC107486901 n=1 Tax=Arachis duranensis TaxID=130453 RepID=A0A6P4D611_ARADU|nr:uncharacterized protein LOC107486901 [Arachis duranensis]
MALQLVDRTFKFPHGVVEDLLVKVGGFIFPADFVVLDMEEEANTSIILGKPFLATAGATIDVQKGELVLRSHEEKMIFNVFKAMSYPKESIGEYMMVDTIEQIVQGVLEEEQCEGTIELEQQTPRGELPQGTKESSIMINHKDNNGEGEPKLELKTLPPSLKYANLALKYLLTKKESKLRLIRWILLLQEFDIEIKDRSGAENKVANHLSRIPQEEEGAHHLAVNESFPDEQLMMIQETPWFADIANFKAIGELPTNINKDMRRKLIKDAKYYIWDEPYLFKKCTDRILRRCISHGEGQEVLWQCHGYAYGGHFSGERIAAKVLQCEFYWPSIFKDAKDLVSRCD